jgi:hypothetical protein
MTKKMPDGSDCPLGDNCSIHYRIDESELYEQFENGRLITYAGDYAVTTEENPYGRSVYWTEVQYVGSGAIADIYDQPETEWPKATRFVFEFSEWKRFINSHNMVVTGVTSGLLDLTQPFSFSREL